MQRSSHIIKPRTLKHFPLCPRAMVDRRRLLRSAGPDKGRERIKQSEGLSSGGHWKSWQRVTSPARVAPKGTFAQFWIPTLALEAQKIGLGSCRRFSEKPLLPAALLAGRQRPWPAAGAMASAGTPGIRKGHLPAAEGASAS